MSVAANLDETLDALRRIEPESVDAVAQRFLNVARRGGVIHFAGNGGAAALSTHAAADFAMPRSFERTGIRTQAAFDGVARLTMFHNDCGPESALRQYALTVMTDGDLLVVNSSSAALTRSRNLVEGVAAAAGRGIDTLAMVPQLVGPLIEHCDHVIDCPGYEVSSECFEVVSLTLIHMIRQQCEELSK